MRFALRHAGGNPLLKSGRALGTATLVWLVLAAFGAACFAQENPTGTVNGVVSSAAGDPIQGARVTITNRSTGQTLVVRTDAAGAFGAVNMPVTDYAFVVDAKGFISATAIANVLDGKTTTVNFSLDAEPVPGVLPAQNLGEIPLNNRNQLSAAQLSPGVQSQDADTIDPTKAGFTSPSFGSQWGREQRIRIDGLDSTDEVVGTTAQSIPDSAVQEFRLGGLTGPFSDQVSSNGAVNIITRSGGNDVHGDLFGDYRNGNALAASLPGGNAHDWERQRYGGAVGGALARDKLFAFLSAERNRQDSLNPVLLGGPFAPLPTALTEIREPFREVDADARLDYVLSPSTRAFYRFTYDSNRDQGPFQQGPSLQSFLTRTSSPAHALGADFTSGNFTHSVRFEYLRSSNAISDTSSAISGFANPIPSVTIDIGGGSRNSCSSGAFFCSGPSYLAPQQTLQSYKQFRYDGTRVRGAHAWRFGVSYNRISAGIFSPFNSIAPTLADEGGAPLSANPVLGISGSPTDPLSYPVLWSFLGNGQPFAGERSAFSSPGGGQRDNRLSAYAGDVWKARENLTVTYGVNWTRDDGKNDDDLGAIPQLNAWQPRLGDRVRQPNYNFGPQVGLAWDPHSSGHTTIRGGVGLFYDNEIFNNILFDRPLRLQQGSYFATPAACVGGAPGRIQWPLPLPLGQPQPLPTAPTAANINADGTVSPNWCGAAIGQAAPLAVALQNAYQSAFASSTGANPLFIGNPGAFAGPYQNGLSLLAPNYQTPRTVEMNIGVQHELKPGLIFTLDYVRNVTTRTLLGVDVNEGGAAATFNATNAGNDRDNAQVLNGCLPGTNQVSCMVAKLGPAGALAAYGAAGIGGPAQVTGGAPCPTCAFPGLQPSLGVNIVNFPEGRSVYSATNVGLQQVIRNFSRGVQRATFQVSYSHSRNVGQVPDPSFVNVANDYGVPDAFTGPTGLDRTHQFSFGALFDLQRSFQLSFTGHLDSPLPVTLRLPQVSGGAEVLVTDVTGDGSTGDIVPGSNVGSYMRGIKPGSLAGFIQNYNTSVAGAADPATPAGAMLVNGGIFSLAELQSLGAVQQPLAAPVTDVAGLGWLKTFDVKLGWVRTYRDRITFEPSVSLFNVFNFANLDLPGNTQNGVLNFGPGSLSPFSTNIQPENTVGGTSPNPLQNFGRTNRAGLGTGLNSSGAPRVVEWGLRISF